MECPTFVWRTQQCTRRDSELPPAVVTFYGSKRPVGPHPEPLSGCLKRQKQTLRWRVWSVGDESVPLGIKSGVTGIHSLIKAEKQLHLGVAKHFRGWNGFNTWRQHASATMGSRSDHRSHTRKRQQSADDPYLKDMHYFQWGRDVEDFPQRFCKNTM